MAGFADLRSRIDGALAELERQAGKLAKPIDLEAISRALGVKTEWRRMVPEGVLSHTDDGLKIYLQNNFLDRPGIHVRQRFTWAHEICHVLFYDLKVLPVKKRPRAPSGPKLEGLCQQGAAYLLVPDKCLASEFSALNPVASMADIDRVVHDYEVSTDVAVRRLHQFGHIKSEYAILLVRSNGNTHQIDAACFGPWLLTVFESPEIGGDFTSWSDEFMRKAATLGDSTWIGSVATGKLTLMRSRRSAYTEIVELRLLGAAG